MHQLRTLLVAVAGLGIPRCRPCVVIHPLRGSSLLSRVHQLLAAASMHRSNTPHGPGTRTRRAATEEVVARSVFSLPRQQLLGRFRLTEMWTRMPVSAGLARGWHGGWWSPFWPRATCAGPRGRSAATRAVGERRGAWEFGGGRGTENLQGCRRASLQLDFCSLTIIYTR
jgi:hypothetical protein